MQDMIDSFHIFCSDDGIISAQRPIRKNLTNKMHSGGSKISQSNPKKMQLHTFQGMYGMLWAKVDRLISLMYQ